MNSVDIAWVADQAAFDAAVADALEQPVIGLDTEFIRERTYYPIAGLVQVGCAGRVYLIDPLADLDLEPLRQLLRAPVLKVLHSVSEDFDVFERLLGVLPEPLLDTQVGAGLAGFKAGLGYQSLVSECLGQALEKGETRSDWLRRPLSDSQCHYAAMDVALLPALYAALEQRLTSLGRMAWWVEEGERCLREARQPRDPQQAWQRLKGAARLQGAALARLRALCAWRESQARSRDLPRGHVLPDATCLELCQAWPLGEAALARVTGGRRPLSVADRAEVRHLLDAASAAPRSQWPAPPPQLPREASADLQSLRDHVQLRATELGVAAELLARRRDLEALLLSGWPEGPWALPPGLAQGWRREVVGEHLLQVLRSRHAECEGETR